MELKVERANRDWGAIADCRFQIPPARTERRTPELRPDFRIRRGRSRYVVVSTGQKLLLFRSGRHLEIVPDPV